MRKIALAAAALILAGCTTNPSTARQALARHGYTDIEITGFAWNACYMPMTQTGFRATSPAGVRVDGVACESVDGSFDVRIR